MNMNQFFVCLDEVLVPLEQRVRGKPHIESYPYVRLWVQEINILPKSGYTAVLHDRRSIQFLCHESGGEQIEGCWLEDLMTGDNPPDKIDIWHIGDRPRTNAWPDSPSEYGPAPGGYRFSIGDVSIFLNKATGHWEVLTKDS